MIFKYRPGIFKYSKRIFKYPFLYFIIWRPLNIISVYFRYCNIVSRYFHKSFIKIISIFRNIPSTITTEHIHISEVVLEEYEDDGFGTYYNLETNPTFTREDMKTAVEMGFSNYGQGFSDDVFEIDTE